MSWPLASFIESLRLTTPMRCGWRGLIYEEAWRRGGCTLSPQAGLAFAQTIGFALFVGLDKLTSHVSHKNGRVLFQFSNSIEEVISRKKASLLLRRVADTRNYPQQIQAYRSLVVVQLLPDPGEQIWSSQGGSNGGAES